MKGSFTRLLVFCRKCRLLFGDPERGLSWSDWILKVEKHIRICSPFRDPKLMLNDFLAVAYQ